MIKLEYTEGKNMISIEKDWEDTGPLDGFLEEVIKPLLLAMSYTPHTINSLDFISGIELFEACGCAYCIKNTTLKETGAKVYKKDLK